ncbi:hypothetical protein SBA3_1780003 [Candidatus Sulfopaludibacter sp. SbA3]|nr:hypothetical protein SBA3_1780003 [Candidatus Sulfopaludibacter sp. SbA3]
MEKPDGRQRPIGIAALEDKIVQQAVVTTPPILDSTAGRPVQPAARPRRYQPPVFHEVSRAERPTQTDDTKRSSVPLG